MVYYVLSWSCEELEHNFKLKNVILSITLQYPELEFVVQKEVFIVLVVRGIILIMWGTLNITSTFERLNAGAPLALANDESLDHFDQCAIWQLQPRWSQPRRWSCHLTSESLTSPSKLVFGTTRWYQMSDTKWSCLRVGLSFKSAASEFGFFQPIHWHWQHIRV